MKNYRKKAILYFSLIIGIINFSNMNNNYIYSIESNITETCDCSTDNSGYYVVSTESSNLNVRSGHGTGYSILTTIPKDTIVYISKANDFWGHVQYNGYDGLCSMAYLTPINNDIITEDIYLSDLSISLMENQEDYTLKLVNVTDTQNITWISQNTDIATVNNGIVTPISKGETIIYAIYNNNYYQCNVTVQENSTLRLNYNSIVINSLDEKFQLELYNNTDNITWISKDTNIANVDNNGLVSGVANGNTIIYAIVNDITFSCFVDVSLKTPILGDCNNDNIISTMDLLILKKYIFGVSNDISNADINMDNNINIIDIIELKQQLITNDLSNQNENIGKYYLTANLNIRENAGTEYQSYGIVDKYTLINVIETKTTNDGVLWGKYEYNDNIGWSSLKYATKLKVTGTTSNGFPIYQADGLTYINDLLIVNKTYSVPSTYIPTNNTLTTQTDNAFISMQKDAAKIGLNLYISSGYRSYSYQQSLYQRYVDSDGQEKADTYSARAGHSEHQTGLCFDLNTINDSFANTAEGIWVSENCHKYGFIVRYPKDKQNITGYKYEPWHLRYVGVEFATELYNSNLTIEEYFGITSEY